MDDSSTIVSFRTQQDYNRNVQVLREVCSSLHAEPARVVSCGHIRFHAWFRLLYYDKYSIAMLAVYGAAVHEYLCTEVELRRLLRRRHPEAIARLERYVDKQLPD